MKAANVVLGAGSMGLAACYHLAKRGEPVLLLEQFAIGHDRGSSHGTARIIRHSYADVAYARLMPQAFAAWRDLEADCGEPLYLRTGGVSLCPPSVDYVNQVAASLNSIGVPHRRMSGKEWNAASPIFAVPEDHNCLFEPDAGIILAERALNAMRCLASSHQGVVIRENSPVRRIDLEGERPIVVLDDATIEAERLIVTAGPWVGSLIPEIAQRVQPERQQVLYFSVGNSEQFSIGQMPVFISVGQSKNDFYYGMPSVLSSGVKVARHGGEATDADADNGEIGERYRQEIRGFLRGCLPSLAEAEISRTEVCKYTVAANEEFLLGPHPQHPKVLIASPCSGHGFKFSCLIGRILSDLTIDGRTDVDIARWMSALDFG